ncbi:MAG TPA: asparagine synthase-related protein, partial [Longimicrobiaceae bacterium]
MSGFVALLGSPGSAVSPQLLGGMTRFLASLGSDSAATWSDGAVGMGHALLRTTPEAARERQPCTLDGTAWLAGDVRLDARGELCAALRSGGRAPAESLPDAELVLHTYHAWGTECAAHLLGDFSFVVWDTRARRLFGARDQLGGRPFFHARAGEMLVASTSLDCVRMHPDVSSELDDRTVADFLLTGGNREPGSTFFRGVHRLPAAHALVCEPGSAPRVFRYWEFPVEEPLRHRRAADYVEEYRDHLRRAVRERLRGMPVSVLMSGGLDSTLVTAVA